MSLMSAAQSIRSGIKEQGAEVVHPCLAVICTASIQARLGLIRSVAGIFVLTRKEVRTMIEIQIQTYCQHCDGQAYLPIGEAESYAGEQYMQYEPCYQCHGPSAPRAPPIAPRVRDRRKAHG